MKERSSSSPIRDYYNSMTSQKGIKAFIKKKIFGNLLIVLMEQEKIISELESKIKEQQRILNENEIYDKDSILLRNKPCLLVDMSVVTNSDAGTGIQRVVNNIFRQIYYRANNIIAVQNIGGNLITSYSYIRRIANLKDEEKPEKIVIPQTGDKIILLDSSWDCVKDFSDILDITSNKGIKSYALVHDLFPIQYPELIVSSDVIKSFCAWHNMLLHKVDTIFCNSRTTADVVTQYYETKQFKRNRPLHLYYFHMGADIPGGTLNARKELLNFVQADKVFLMVGTLEPRKGHMVVLEAFSRVLKDNHADWRILIIGHNGWKNDEIRKKINLPEYKGRVLWIQDASDEELRWAYTHADALIAASKDEGFGLPLIEAAYFGLPIICSDIPIFREVTQGHADYFKVMDADSLANCMMKWITTEKHPDSRKIPIYTWEDSAQEILDIIYDKVKPYKVLS